MTEYTPTQLHFYLTSETDCPYLPDRMERKLFTHLSGRNANHLHNMLGLHGFRRSQNIAYRPVCMACNACKSARVLVDRFEMNASQRRVWRKNADIIGVQSQAFASREQYAMFQAYTRTRHRDGSMADMTYVDYELMIEDTPVHSHVVEYRQIVPDHDTEPRLVGVALSDLMSDGISMIYSFFDPRFSKRSLGRYIVLDHIERAKRASLPFVYLGYWVPNSPKMAYKSEFKPIEIHSSEEHWIRLPDNKPRVITR